MADMNDLSKPLPEFELLRKQLLQQGQQQQGLANDAIARRFAQLGNLNSGAQLKIQQRSDEGLANAQNQALGSLGLQEAQAKRGLNEAALNRALQQGALDVEKQYKLGTLDIAKKEQDLDTQTLAFNKALSAVENGDEDSINQWLQYYLGRNPGLTEKQVDRS